MPNPKIPLDYKELDALLQFKVTKSFCADYLKVSENTIDRRLREDHDKTFGEYHELKIERTGVKLQQKAIEMALKGDRTMLIFSLKNLAKWSDKIENKIEAGKMITLNYNLSTEEDGKGTS